MDELINVLERRAERGVSRGADEVWRAAQVDIVEPPVQRGPRGHRAWWPPVAAVVVLALVVGAALVVRVGDDHAKVSGGFTTELHTLLARYDSDRLVLADPTTGEERSISGVGHSCITCPLIVLDGTIWGADLDGAFRVEPPYEQLERLATIDRPGYDVFPDASGTSVFVTVRADSENPPNALIRIDTRTDESSDPRIPPPGYRLPSTPRAVTDGVLVVSDDRRDELAVWQPDTGGLRTLVEGVGRVVDTFTPEGSAGSVVAFIDRTDSLSLVDTNTGALTQVRIDPNRETSWIGGGAFSPDGTHLAAFANGSDSERGLRGAHLAIVDTAAALGRELEEPTLEYGESYAWATWATNDRVVFGTTGTHAYAASISGRTAEELAVPAAYSWTALPVRRSSTPPTTSATLPTTPVTNAVAPQGTGRVIATTITPAAPIGSELRNDLVLYSPGTREVLRTVRENVGVRPTIVARGTVAYVNAFAGVDESCDRPTTRWDITQVDLLTGEATVIGSGYNVVPSLDGTKLAYLASSCDDHAKLVIRELRSGGFADVTWLIDDAEGRDVAPVAWAPDGEHLLLRFSRAQMTFTRRPASEYRLWNTRTQVPTDAQLVPSIGSTDGPFDLHPFGSDGQWMAVVGSDDPEQPLSLVEYDLDTGHIVRTLLDALPAEGQARNPSYTIDLLDSDARGENVLFAVVPNGSIYYWSGPGTEPVRILAGSGSAAWARAN